MTWHHKAPQKFKTVRVRCGRRQAYNENQDFASEGKATEQMSNTLAEIAGQSSSTREVDSVRRSTVAERDKTLTFSTRNKHKLNIWCANLMFDVRT